MVVIEAAPGPGSCAVAACDCGQELDCCERAHCPRCGCQIHRAA